MRFHRALLVAALIGLLWSQASAGFVPPSGVVPGQIFDSASDPSLIGNSPLDPNGDGWITSTGLEFSSNILDESDEFEGADWRVIWHYGAEPTHDLATGASCGISEIVDNQNTGQHAAYYRFIDPDNDPSNRNEQLVFRIRIADEGTGAFGYSILVDTDQKFGSTGISPDANAVSGNPGFEMEILYGSGGGNSGVTVQDVDGVTSGFTELAHYAIGVRNQRSYAKFTNCSSGDPVFLDFYIDVDDFPVGTTAATPLRFVFATSSSPSTALGGSASDIGGVDDGHPDFTNNDAAFTTVVNSTPLQTFATGSIACTDVWYLDADGDGLGSLSTDSTACTQPIGYVSDNTDLCDDNTACNYDANSVTNAACTYATTWYADADGDGLGDSSDSQSSCTQPSGYVSDNTDLCDDNTACNYDGNSVTNAACTYATTWYADADGDGLGDSSDSQSSCTQPSGYVSDSTDLCDDNTACNYDANSVTNAACTYETTWYADADGDGLGDSSDSQSSCTQPSGYVSDNTDLCDDNTACNYDGNSVTNAACAYVMSWYLDADGDGLGVLLSDSIACTQPSGYVSDSTDLCDDNTACNYDANSVTNAACTYATTWYADLDGDGLGDSSDSQSACTQPSGYVSDSTDLCDDNTACNYDANSVTNAACTYATTWYADLDGDGLGDSSDSQSACTQPSGYVSDSTDLCDDNTACNYDANSVTNAVCTYATTWYADVDGDGLGDSGDSQSACTQPSGYVSDSTDLCDDNTACNYDGNSVTNAACTYATTWYADADGDALGDSSDSQSSCTQPSGYVSDSTDLCDDNTACNYDGNSITNAACTYATTWYADTDGDGLGDSSDSQSSCTQPSGYVSDNTDLCDDNTACNYDGNSVTNAACTYATTWYADTDGDGLGDSGDSQSSCTQPSGYVSDSTDLCDDNTACNYDANSVTNAACTYATTWYADLDGDGLGDSSDSQSACTQPSGYVSDSTDLCDDTSALNYNSESNTACEYPASTLLASIIGCDGQDDLTFDLDTIHSYTGITSYSISTGITGTYASASISGSEMTFDFSGEGVGSDTLYVTASGSGPSQQLKLYFEEAEYPIRTSPIKALAASSPGANDGGLQVSLSGTYGEPVTLHLLGFEDCPIVNGIAQCPYGTHMITGFTNVKGCLNDDPMSPNGPSGSPTPARLMVPCVPCSQP